MKQKVAILIVLALSFLLLAGCVDARPHAYLIEGRYECENIVYDGNVIDRIEVDVKDVTASEYDKNDTHIIECEDKAYCIDFEIWINGEKKTFEYRAGYMFNMRNFYIDTVDLSDFRFDFGFVTAESNGEYFLTGGLYFYSKQEYEQKKNQLVQEGKDPRFEDLIAISETFSLKKVH